MDDRKIFVVGSLNADHRVPVSRIPSAGETVLGGEVTVSAGGKGANQAVAAARAGAAVTIVGAIGDDHDGELVHRALVKDGVSTDHVRVIPGATTGRALISVDDAGENSIIVSPGANSALTVGDVDAGLVDMRDGDLLLLQLETPLPLVRYAARRAAELGGTVIVNAAPVPASAADLFSHLDVLVVNDHELVGIAEQLRTNTTGERAADMTALALAADAAVVCTAGADGAFLAHDGRIVHVEATRVAAVDTTAAGDTFIGFLAAGLAADPSDVAGALECAAQAAALTVTRPGAIDSIPYQEALS